MNNKNSAFVRRVNNAGMADVVSGLTSGLYSDIGALATTTTAKNQGGTSSSGGGKLSGSDKAGVLSGFFSGFGDILSGAGDLVGSITGKYKPAPVTNVYAGGSTMGNITPWLIGGGLLVVVIIIIVLIARK